MPSQIRVLIAATGLALAMGGCDRSWVEFQRIELGQTLPQQSLLRSLRNEGETTEKAAAPQTPEFFGRTDYDVWPVPLSYGMHGVSANTDDKGLVIAKAYFAMVSSNYVLFTAAAMRQVLELRPPTRLLLNPTEKAKPDETLVDLDKNPTLHSYITNTKHGPTGNASANFTSLRPPPHCLMLASGINYTTGMSLGSRFHDLEESLKRLPLKGIELEGYDRTFRPVLGGSIRLQNLGQGRIRIETKLFHLYDPLALSAQLYFHLSQQ